MLRSAPRADREDEFDPSALVFRERVHHAVDANWKIAVENYLECCHCPVAHPDFSALVDVDPDADVLEESGEVWSLLRQRATETAVARSTSCGPG
jgi:phenylpropionate dioxygenase-like ring-hydroxylating dioxygenase large terminal subunit